MDHISCVNNKNSNLKINDDIKVTVVRIGITVNLFVFLILNCCWTKDQDIFQLLKKHWRAKHSSRCVTLSSQVVPDMMLCKYCVASDFLLTQIRWTNLDSINISVWTSIYNPVFFCSHLQMKRKQLFLPGVSEYIIDRIAKLSWWNVGICWQPLSNSRTCFPSHSPRSSSNPAPLTGLEAAVVMEMQELPQLQIRLPWKWRSEMLR